MTTTCVQCAATLQASRSHRKYCSGRCKARWRKTHGGGSRADGHVCRICGARFEIGPGEHNRWLCSDACRRASNAKSVREFHQRRPTMEPIYRARTRAKRLPEGNLIRFRRTNPNAPMSCEACGESRVLDVAHKPGHERIGQWRSATNCRWPEMVWVLCPTCHALLDRMNYQPEDIGLQF